MVKLLDYPGVGIKRRTSSGTVWRYREPGRNGLEITLPGQPGEPAFEEAYDKATKEGVRRDKAELVAIISGRTVGAAYRLLLRTREWADLDNATQDKNDRYLNQFMKMPVGTMVWRDIAMADIKTRNIRKLLDEMRMTKPTAAKHMLVAIRKLTRIAIKEEWIEYDPTFTLEASVPATQGHKAWSKEQMDQYRNFHPVGSAARTAFELALWLGNRRGDVARLKWENMVEAEVEVGGEIRDVTAFEFRQQKNSKRTGGKEMFLPVRSELAKALAPLDRSTSHVLMTSYGNPFSEKSLTGMMAHWSKRADLPKGLTLHGLRKSFGIYLAENGATGPQIQNSMGHSSIREADAYLHMVNKKRLVSDAFTVGEQRELERQAAHQRKALRVVK